MATESAAPKGLATASDPVFAPFTSFTSTDWVKTLSDTPAKIYAEGWGKALGFAAARMQEQAAYLKQLSAATDPAEALKLNAAFAQESVKRALDDGAKIFDGFRASVAAGAPGK